MNILKEILLQHRGHKVVIASYGDYNNPACVCLECDDCNEVLIDSETYDLQENKD